MVTASTQKKIKLDKIDRKILNDLQANGRTTNVDLAKNAGISAPPCLRRVRALEDNNIILGYFAEMNAKKLGFGITAFATVRLKEQNDSDVQAFETEVNKWNNVREAYIISGDFDFMLKVVAHDWDEYQEFLTDTLTRFHNVASVRTAMQVKKTKYQPGVPINTD